MNLTPHLILQGIGVDLVLYEDRFVLQKHGVIADIFEAEADREIPLCVVKNARITEGYSIWNSYLQCDVKPEAGLPVMIMFHQENEEIAREMQGLIYGWIGNRETP
jgi:hypothetical protein